MCGIVAAYGAADTETLERMLERVAHRGPDDRGAVEIEEGWLGHRRLSIVDVGGGKQPLVTSDGEMWLVGNGEVYNHAEIRATLADSDFQTDSDNEVALHLIDERGPMALAELNGMFAFVAGGRGKFVAARDPVGIKPLYWAERDGAVRFASEMHAFAPEWRPYVTTFPPGHQWTPEAGLERFARAAPCEPRGSRPTPDELRDVLVESVRRQLMGDVPVGVFLSGGLDSSLVAAIAARQLERSGERLKTFAVGLEGSSDLLAARSAAEHLGSEH